MIFIILKLYIKIIIIFLIVKIMKVKFNYKTMSIIIDLKYDNLEVGLLKSNLLNHIKKEFKNSNNKDNNYLLIKELIDDSYFLKFYTENELKIPVELKDDTKINNKTNNIIKIIRSFKVDYKDFNISNSKIKVEEVIKNVTGANTELKIVNQTNPSKLNGINSLFNSLFQNNSSMNNIGNNNIESLLLNQIFNPLINRPRPQVQPDINLVNNLIEMGFDDIRSRRALTITNNNMERAVEILANDDPILDSNINSQQSLNSDSVPLMNVNMNLINEGIDIHDQEDEEFDDNDNENENFSDF